MLWLARAQTRLLQSGYLRIYLKVVLGTAVGLVTLALIRERYVPQLARMDDVYLHEWITGGVIVAGAITVTLSQSRLAAVAALGTVGYGVSLIYLLFGAPDLAMTQFCIETLTVILFESGAQGLGYGFRGDGPREERASGGAVLGPHG
jgi:multicomponent Na+:H+ antiporter subunit A